MASAPTSPGPRIAVALAVLAGCALGRPPPLHPEAPRGSWYVFQAGDTLPGLAARSGVPLEDLLEINGLTRASVVTPGQVVFLLDAEAPRPTAPTPALAVESSSLRWPLAQPRLSSAFGSRWGKSHEGIDLAAPTGTAIYAADGGQVLYAGDAVRGYGNMVVVQHRSDLLTVYAHGSVLLVHTGDRITAGQEIARVGQSGHATAPHLHFEVRRGQVPQDPLRFLPRLEPGK
jgi:murein DD-endopeptidase MepM/ murein hydrolase activator NlpD